MAYIEIHNISREKHFCYFFAHVDITAELGFPLLSD